MRVSIILFIITTFLSCSSVSQNNETKTEKDSIEKGPIIPKVKKFTSLEIDSIPDIKEGENEKSPKFIKQRLELLIGKSYKERCENINISYPPNYVLFRTFKPEKEFEIWVANKRSDSLQLLVTLPICAVEDEPGAKLMH